MDRDLVALSGDHHNYLEQIACGSRSDDEPAVRVLSGIFKANAWSIAWRRSWSATPCLRAES